MRLTVVLKCSYTCRLSRFVNRFLLKTKRVTAPHDAAKLRISRRTLERVFAILDIPSDFVYALSRYYLPCGRGYCSIFSKGDSVGSELWYILPLRMQVRCTASPRCQITSNSGSNQMDPFHHLHLPNQAVDIRGSLIALTFRYNKSCKSTSMLAVNFIDGRWPKTAQEPESKIKEVLGDAEQFCLKSDPFFIQLIYLTSAMRLWTNALNSIHDQLIAYEIRLQNDEEVQPATSIPLQDTNRALHAIAAHLHRYASELKSLDDTIAAMIKYHRLVWDYGSNTPGEAFQKVENGLHHIVSQLKAIKDFELELEKKIQNSLALLFNRIQLSNDRVMLANGAAMQAIMEATQEETKVSRSLAVKAHKLSESMRKDSLSMRTIAVCTMFFLPGTSFAAVLSMPFFDNDWMKGPSRFWLWIVITIPSTVLAFAFYFYRQSRNDAKYKTGNAIEMVA